MIETCNMVGFWIWHFARVLRLAGSHSINPLIYGLLDKKLPQEVTKNIRELNNRSYNWDLVIMLQSETEKNEFGT